MCPIGGVVIFICDCVEIVGELRSLEFRVDVI